MAAKKKTIGQMTPEELEAIFLDGVEGDGAQKRIKALIKRLGEANERADAAEEALGTARETATTEARTAADTEWQSKLDSQREDMALARLGVADDESVFQLRRAHGQLPEQDRPPLSDWVKTLQKDEAARKDLSPVTLAALAIKQGGAPNLSGGADTPQPIDERAIQAAFGEGQAAVDKLLARFPA